MELLVLRSLLQIVAMLSIAIRNGEDLLGSKGQRGLLQLQVKKNITMFITQTRNSG